MLYASHKETALDSWVIDSCTTYHMTSHHGWFFSMYEMSGTRHAVVFGNNETLEVKGKGVCLSTMMVILALSPTFCMFQDLGKILSVNKISDQSLKVDFDE